MFSLTSRAALSNSRVIVQRQPYCFFDHFEHFEIKRKPHGYWKHESNQKEFIGELKEILKIKSPKDWANVKSTQVRRYGGASLISKYRSLQKALEHLFPEEDWNKVFGSDIPAIDLKREIQREIEQAQREYKSAGIPDRPPPKPRSRRPKAPGKDLMLSQVWNDDVDPTGWWISEKYDGIRAFWSGEVLASRHGRIIPAPDWFLKHLPPGFPVDGELWAGYEKNVTKVTRSSNPEYWKECKLMAFDSPDEKLNFEERIEKLHKNVTENEYLKFVPFTKCESREHLQKVLKEVVDRKGEGLMLREPEANYAPGRSFSMCKVKLQLDADAKFIKKAPRCFGYDCELPNGAIVTIRCTHTDYKYPPEVGTVLRVKHFGEWDGTGKLKNPYFCGRRMDGATWEDLVAIYNKDRGIDPNAKKEEQVGEQNESDPDSDLEQRKE